MPSPFKHPRTGVYWYRQRVPSSIKSLAKGQKASISIADVTVTRTIGAELVMSLGTKDPKIARLLVPTVQAQFDEVWASFANSPSKLTNREIVEYAGEAFRAFQAAEDDPGDPEIWRGVLRANQYAEEGKNSLGIGLIGGAEAVRQRVQRVRFGPFVDAVLRKHKRRVPEESYVRLLAAFSRAMTDAAELLLKRSEGDYSPDSRGEKYPEVSKKGHAEAPSTRALTFDSLIEHKQKTQDRSLRTFATYRAKLADLSRFVGHTSPERLTKSDIRRWRDDLLARGLAKKTINDQYLSAVKSVLNHGVKEFDLPVNVADRIRDERNDPAPNGSKGYSLEQARTILAATFKGVKKSIALPYRRAAFWLPWICAYTGLRVGEAAQLTGKSVREHEGIPYLVITPEDGGTKGGNAWTTGIHEHLIELGLLEMFREIGPGPAFYVPYTPDTELTKIRTHRSKDAAERVADWIVDEVGIVAPLGRPNHAWRHSFTTLSREYGMDKEARDYMMGSRSQTDAREGYGDWTPKVVNAEINKLPRFQVDESTWRPSNERTQAVPLRGSTPTKRIRKSRAQRC